MTDIDQLNIEITSDTKSAVSSLQALVETLKTLKQALEETVSNNSVKQLKALQDTVQKASSPNTKALQEMKKAMNGDTENKGGSKSGADNRNGRAQAETWKSITKEIMAAQNQVSKTTSAVMRMQDVADRIDWGKLGDTQEVKALQDAVTSNVADMQRLKTQVDANNQAFVNMGGVINSTSAHLGKINTSSQEAQRGLNNMVSTYKESVDQLKQVSINAQTALQDLKRISDEQMAAAKQAHQAEQDAAKQSQAEIKKQVDAEKAKQREASRSAREAVQQAKAAEKEKQAAQRESVRAAQTELRKQVTAEKAAAAEAKDIASTTDTVGKSFVQAQAEVNKLTQALTQTRESIDSVDVRKLGDTTQMSKAIEAYQVAEEQLENLKRTAEECRYQLNLLGATTRNGSISFENVDTENEEVVSSLKRIADAYDESIYKAKSSMEVAKSYQKLLAKQPQVDMSTVSQGPDVSGSLKNLDSGQLDQILIKLNNLSPLVSTLRAGFSKLGASIKEIREHPLQTLKSLLDTTAQSAKRTLGVFGKLGGAVARVSGNVMKRAWDASVFHRFGEAVGEARKKYEMFKRSIAFSIIYRVLGASITMMTNAIKVGIENLYQYSKLTGTMFAPAMNSLATSALYLKNAFATVAAPLIEAVAPAVDFLIDKFVALLNIIGKVFAALTGKSTFTQAKKHAVEYGDAISGANKALKSFTIGIDELNIIEDSAGAAGGAMEDFGNMFEEVEIDNGTLDWAKAVREAIANGDWYGAGTLLADKLNEVVASWDTESWGRKLGEKIKNGVSLGLGFLRTVNTENYGQQLASFLNGVVHSVNWDNVGALMGAGFNRALDFVRGFLEKVDASAIGQSIAKIFKGFFSEINWDNIVETLSIGVRKIKEFLNGFLAELGEWTEPIQKAIAKIEGDIQKAITATKNWAADLNIEPLKEAWGGFLEVVGKLAEVLSGAFLWAYENVLLPFGKWTIEKGLPTLLEKFSAVIEGLTSVLEGIAPYAKQFYEEFLKPVGKWIWEKVIAWIGEFAGVLQKIGDALKERKSLSEFWDSLDEGEKQFVIITGAITGAAGLVGALGLLKGALSFMSSPTGVLALSIIGVVELVNAFRDWYNESEGFRNFVDGTVELIKEIITAISELIGAIWQAGQDLAKFFGFGHIAPTPKDVLANKYAPALEEMRRVQDMHLGAMTLAQTVAFATQKKNAEDHGIDLANGIGFGLGEIINKTNAWSDDYDLSVRRGVGRAQVTAHAKMADMENEFVAGYGNIDKDTVKGFNDIDATMGGKMDEMKKTADGKLDDLDTAMKQGYSDINSSTDNEWQEIVKTIERTMNAAILSAPKWGKDIVNGIAQGIRGSVTAIETAMNIVAQKIAAPVHHSEPDVGPLKDDSTYMPDMMKSFASGIKDNTPRVVNEVVDMADQVAHGVKDTLQTVGETTTTGMNTLSKNLLQNVGNAIGESVGQIMGTFGKISVEAPQWGNEISSKLADGIISGADKVKMAVEYIAKIVKQGLSFTENATASVDAASPLKETKDTIPKLMDTYTTDYKKYAPKLTDTVVNTTAQVAKGVADTLTDVSAKTETGIGKLASGLMDKLKGTIGSAANHIKTTLQTAATDSTELGQNITVGIADGMQEKVSVVKEAVDTIANSIESRLSFGQELEGPLKDSKEYMPNMMKTFADGIESNIANVVNQVVNLSQGIIDTLTTLFTNIDRMSDAAWKRIHSNTRNELTRLHGVVFVQMQILVSMLGQVFNELQTNAYMWGNQFTNRLADGIMAGVSKIQFAVGFIAAQIQQRIGFSEPSIGPLSDFHTYMPDMIDLMAKGINDNSYKVLNAVRGLSESVASSVDELAHTKLTFPVHEIVTVDYRNVQNAPDGSNEPVEYVNNIDTESMTQAMKSANSEIVNLLLSAVDRLVNSIDDAAERPIEVSLDGKRMDRAQEKRQRQKGADIMGKGVTVY